MKPGFLIYTRYGKILSALSTRDMGKLFQAIFSYEIDEVIPIFEGKLGIAFSFIKEDLDKQTEKYNQIVARNRKNGKSGGRPNPVGSFSSDVVPDKQPSGLAQEPSGGKEKKKKEKIIYIVKTDKGDVKINQQDFDRGALALLKHFNEVTGSKGRTIETWKDNLAYWLKIYTQEQVIEAINNIPREVSNENKPSGFWHNMDLVKLFRTRNQNGVADNLGTLLNK